MKASRVVRHQLLLLWPAVWPKWQTKMAEWRLADSQLDSLPTKHWQTSSPTTQQHAWICELRQEDNAATTKLEAGGYALTQLELTAIANTFHYSRPQVQLAHTRSRLVYKYYFTARLTKSLINIDMTKYLFHSCVSLSSTLQTQRRDCVWGLCCQLRGFGLTRPMRKANCVG